MEHELSNVSTGYFAIHCLTSMFYVHTKHFRKTRSCSSAAKVGKGEQCNVYQCCYRRSMRIAMQRIPVCGLSRKRRSMRRVRNMYLCCLSRKGGSMRIAMQHVPVLLK